MTFILVGTMLAGFVSAKLLTLMGVEDIAWRYLGSIIVSYATFIALVRIWLYYIFGMHKDDTNPDTLDALELIPNVTFDNLSTPSYKGGGGNFSGGGSSSSWADKTSSSASSSDKGLFSGLDFDADGEALPFIVAIIIIGIIFCFLGFGIYLVWEAPAILSEIALEMAISLGLLSQIKKHKGDWFVATFKKTVIFVMVFAFLVFLSLKTVLYYHPNVKNSQDIRQALRDSISSKI